jgi:hypothetical protein
MQDVPTARPEEAMLAALTLARAQMARSLELRAALGLGWLWTAAGRADDARALVGDLYRWFTEGLDTWDLRDARASLDAGLGMPS